MIFSGGKFCRMGEANVSIGDPAFLEAFDSLG